MKTTYDNQYTVASLYDGGWRSSDRDALIAEYNLDKELADEICEELGTMEWKAVHEKAVELFEAGYRHNEKETIREKFGTCEYDIEKVCEELELIEEESKPCYWKVYARCAVNAVPVKQIDRDEAKSLIENAVFENDYSIYEIRALTDMLNHGEIAEEEYDKKWKTLIEKYYQTAWEWFLEKGGFGCGDYGVVVSGLTPPRPDSWGTDVSLL